MRNLDTGRVSNTLDTRSEGRLSIDIVSENISELIFGGSGSNPIIVSENIFDPEDSCRIFIRRASRFSVRISIPLSTHDISHARSIFTASLLRILTARMPRFGISKIS